MSEDDRDPTGPRRKQASLWLRNASGAAEDFMEWVRMRGIYVHLVEAVARHMPMNGDTARLLVDHALVEIDEWGVSARVGTGRAALECPDSLEFLNRYARFIDPRVMPRCLLIEDEVLDVAFFAERGTGHPPPSEPP